jgi:adenylate cyclase
VSTEGEVNKASKGFLQFFGGFCFWGGDPMATGDVKRKLTAIFSADVEGYSRLMGEDELATVETLTSHKETMGKLIRQYRGRVVDSTGDNLLAEFASVVDAIQCAVEVQQVLSSKNEALPENRRMYFRIGINSGDVIEEGERIYGDGVNVAARVESLAKGGGISISGTAYDQLGKKLPLGYEYLGEQTVKNIEKPVRVYRVLTEAEAAGKVIGEKRPKPTPWRWAAVAIAIVILAVGALAIRNFYFRPALEPVSEEDMALPLPDKPSIAVLPFVNIGDPEQEYFSDGITEQIITGLARNPYLFVIASNSTFTYKGKPVMVQQVSRELGVQYVVEGSVQKSGDRIRITAQLIDATTGEHIWAENYDRDLKDIFALQDEITIEILKATMGKLLGFGDLSRVKGTTNVEAYLKFLKARPLSSTNERNNRIAQQLLEESIALDPDYAQAYASLGVSYAAQAMNGWSLSPGKDLQKAFELAQKAISLDQALHVPHGTLGWIYLLQGKHDEAIAEAKKAVDLAPNNAWANGCLGTFLAYADRPDEAIAVSENALRLNPFPDDWDLLFAYVGYCVAGRYEEALAYSKKAQKRNPDNMWSYVYQAGIYGHLGREQEARAAAKEVLRLNPKFSLEQYEKAPWYKNRDKWNLHINGLRKAGLK